MRFDRIRFILLGLVLLGGLVLPCSAETSGARVFKVLPQWLDTQGRASLSPSLYERDAYQAYLRKAPSEVSALRFHVHWKAPARSTALRLRVEIRGSKIDQVTPVKIESPVTKGWFSRTWSSVLVSPEVFSDIGAMTAWRVTLLDGDTELAEQKSYLWSMR